MEKTQFEIENEAIVKHFEESFDGKEFYELEKVVFEDENTVVVHYIQFNKPKTRRNERQRTYERRYLIKKLFPKKCKFCGGKMIERGAAYICHMCQIIVMKG